MERGGEMSLWGKFIAGILVVIGTQGFGVALSQEMRCKLYHLNEQKRMLFYAMREIAFLHKPMQEIFLSLSERLQKPYDIFLKNVADKMEDGSGRNLSVIWQEEVLEVDKHACYPKNTFYYLEKMQNYFQCEEDEMQKESFDMLYQELVEEIEYIKKYKKEKDKLIKTLSLLAGMLCIVIFM